jgi:beta-N-acetylhexosaminidase
MANQSEFMTYHRPWARSLVRIATLVCPLLLWAVLSPAQTPQPAPRATEAQWVDSVYAGMTPDERIGQLFMIRAHSDKDAAHIQEVSRQIREYHVGGLCFFQGTPEKQAALTNQFQRQARIPLLVAMDAEWGLSMRHKEAAPNFPRQLTLGAIQENKWIYRMGQEIGRELRAIGVHVNFAPVADVNNNPLNPVIHDRSFGEDRYQVAAKSILYARGLLDAGVLGCAKHFPGHGDTDTDSHADLPVIRHDKNRLDSLELYPFKALAQDKVPAMMVAHLNIPALDKRKNRPTTLSEKVVKGILRDQWNYDGLVFTDALEMQGVLKFFKPGEVELEAFHAGNDVLLLPQDMDAAFARMKKAWDSGEIADSELETRVKRILRAKYRVGLDSDPVVDVAAIRPLLNSARPTALANSLYEKAVTLVNKEGNTLPLCQPEKVVSIAVGVGRKNAFQDMLGKFGITRFLQVGYIQGPEGIKRIDKMLGEGDIPVISLHNMEKSASKNFGVSQDVIDLIQHLKMLGKSPVVVVFGTPYSLRFFETAPNLVMAYEDTPGMQQAAAQAICGALSFEGRLPVSASPKMRYNRGYLLSDRGIFKYGLPEQEGMSSDTLELMRSLMEEMIRKKAAPGGQVFIARNGRVVYEESFGYFTYEKKHPVTNEDIYDLASLTKVLAGTAAIMKLNSTDLISLTSPISRYIDDLSETNKRGLALQDIMAHRAGLLSWIPFYRKTLDDSDKATILNNLLYHDITSPEYAILVADKIFLRNDYRDSIWKTILLSELDPNPEYNYSDLGFYMVSELVKRVDGRPLDIFFEKEIAEPLGLQKIGYNPLTRGMDLSRIAPSEDDQYYRQQILKGYVHDMGAAMLGGVSGHAGLFSNARDVGTIMQSFLNGGEYGGVRLFEPGVVQKFSRRHPGSTRRGIGFDMKELDPYKPLNMSRLASASTFGHLGFTGTCTWADPETGTVFVFLSNRTFPTMSNSKFSAENYRPRAQSIMYRSINEKP